MKNIHLLTTDKPSRFTFRKDYRYYRFRKDEFINNDTYQNQNIYITSDEEITGFENNIWVHNNGRVWLWQNTMALRSDNKPKKIILTTDQDLIKDGVQAIDDEFLEWFVNNSSCEEVEVKKFNGFAEDYLIIIPKEEQKQETLEEAIKREYETRKFNSDFPFDPQSFKLGAKWQQEPEQFFSDDRVKTLEKSIEYLLKRQEKMYSEEEVIDLLQEMNDWPTTFEGRIDIKEWFEQYKKK